MKRSCRDVKSDSQIKLSTNFPPVSAASLTVLAGRDFDYDCLNALVAVVLLRVVRDSMLQCVAVCCSVLQCVAVCCSVLQCVAVCCSVC